MSRACDGKLSYSPADAEKAAREMEAKKGEAFNAYKCPECEDWHIGHTPFKPREGTNKMATTIVKPPQEVPTGIHGIRFLLEKSKEQIAMALPQHMTPERMIRVAITAAQKQVKLLECTPLSVIGCIIEASQLGLYPDGILGDAYLVPFFNGKTRRMEAQLQPGYRGLINLARRSGQVSAIYSEPVYACDKFKIELGTDHTINHVPNYEDPQRGAEKDADGVPVGLRGVYAVVKFKDGTADFEYMPLHRIMEIRNGSKAKDREGNITGPWATHFEEMARKTPIRRLAKRLPLSPEFQKAAVLDEYVDAGVATDFTSEIDANSELMRVATESKSQELDAKYAAPVEAAVQPEGSVPNPPRAPENVPSQVSPTPGPQHQKEFQATEKHSTRQRPQPGVELAFNDEEGR